MEQTIKHVRTRQTSSPRLKQSNTIKPTLPKHTQRDNLPNNARNTIQVSMEKYTTLAREAMTSGDRVLAESFYQQAEHYLRLNNEYKKSIVAAPRKSKPISPVQKHAIPDDFEMSIEQELAIAQFSSEND